MFGKLRGVVFGLFHGFMDVFAVINFEYFCDKFKGILEAIGPSNFYCNFNIIVDVLEVFFITILFHT